MSTIKKPQPKFGWTEEIALQHEEAIDTDRETAFIETLEQNGVEIRHNLIGPIEQPVPALPIPLPCELYGGDGGCLPRERPEGRLEEILQCKARAPIAESPWASFAAQVIKFTGVRRAIPTTNPGEIRIEADHHLHSTPGKGPQNTVYVGVPVS